MSSASVRTTVSYSSCLYLIFTDLNKTTRYCYSANLFVGLVADAALITTPSLLSYFPDSHSNPDLLNHGKALEL